MAVNFFQEWNKGISTAEAVEQAKLQTRQAEIGYADALYETNPQEGIEYAKKIGMLPANAELTEIAVDGVAYPAAKIPGLEKPIILPKAGRQQQQTAARATAAKDQERVKQLEVEKAKADLKFRATQWTEEKRGEIRKLVTELQNKGRLDASVMSGVNRLESLAAQFELNWASDEHKQVLNQEMEALKAQLQGKLLEQRGDQTMEQIGARNEGALAVAGVRTESAEKIAADRNSTNVFLKNMDVKADRELQAQKDAAAATRITIKGDVNRNLQSQKDAAAATRIAMQAEAAAARQQKWIEYKSKASTLEDTLKIPKLQPPAVTTRQSEQTLEAIAPMLSNRGYDVDDDDYATAQRQAEAIAQATNTIYDAYRKMRVPTTQAAIQEAIVKTLSQVDSDAWVTDADTGQDVINLDKLQEMVDTQIDRVRFKDAIAAVRKQHPAATAKMTDQQIIEQLEEDLINARKAKEGR